MLLLYLSVFCNISIKIFSKSLVVCTTLKCLLSPIFIFLAESQPYIEIRFPQLHDSVYGRRVSKDCWCEVSTNVCNMTSASWTWTAFYRQLFLTFCLSNKHKANSVAHLWWNISNILIEVSQHVTYLFLTFSIFIFKANSHEIFHN